MNPTPDLCVPFGLPAVGKAAVGTELARQAGWRLFHNHLTVAASRALLHGLEGQVRWFSEGEFPYAAQHLVIDAETLDSAARA